MTTPTRFARSNAHPLKDRTQAAQEFRWLDRQSHGRANAEAYITQQYRFMHHAHVTSFSPHLLVMVEQNRLQACVGVRPGSETPLFLEHYLDCPIDQAIAGIRNGPVNRNAIVEIGNLVATQRGSSLVLFLIMAAALEQAGFQWLAFTATPQVAKLIHRLRFTPHILAEAKAERLGDSQTDWGTYYNSHPKVMAGSIPEAMAVVRSQPLTQKILQRHAQAIEALASELTVIRWSETL